MLLSAEKIFKNFGMKQLLDGTDVFINNNDRLGLIGLNGTGKSTLLKILAGEIPADEGKISTATNLKISYLPQNPHMNDDFTVLEQIKENFKNDETAYNEYEAKSLLTTLGVMDFDAKISTLSGGQRKRTALVAALIKPCDLLILDEPTNHLDSFMVSFLENTLKRFNGAIIMITHDRYFLERVCNKILELHRGTIYTYEGNYSKYLEIKSARFEMEKATERKRQSILRTEYQWIMRGARARGTKSKDRIDRYEQMKSLNSPTEDDNIQMSTISSRLGKQIIEIENISKNYGEKCVTNNFSYNMLKGDRIGIVGKNGAGKTTLLNMLTGKMTSDSGKVTIGATVKIGYFTQESSDMPLDKKVYDYIKDIAVEVKTNEGTFSASQMLDRFLFEDDIKFSFIKALSGGEKRRLYLLGILMSSPNILVLDEPTNDLDIDTLAILEDYFIGFDGAVITVSHDRYFLDKIATSIFEVGENGIINRYMGNYTDYLEQKPEETKAIKKAENNVKKEITEKPKKLKFSFNEKREFETIDDDIANLEDKIANIEKEILSCGSDYVKLQKLMEEKENTTALLSEKEERWIYLNDLNDKINSEN